MTANKLKIKITRRSFFKCLRDTIVQDHYPSFVLTTTKYNKEKQLLNSCIHCSYSLAEKQKKCRYLYKKSKCGNLPGLMTSHGSTTVSFVTTLKRFPCVPKVGNESGSWVGFLDEAKPVNKKI